MMPPVEEQQEPKPDVGGAARWVAPARISISPTIGMGPIALGAFTRSAVSTRTSDSGLSEQEKFELAVRREASGDEF